VATATIADLTQSTHWQSLADWQTAQSTPNQPIGTACFALLDLSSPPKPTPFDSDDGGKKGAMRSAPPVGLGLQSIDAMPLLIASR
jgi:hypothetical protein